jgi:hypothetical protein
MANKKKKKGKKTKHRRGEHHRRGNVTFGGALAAGGEVSSVIGIVIAWIMAVGLVLGGLYFGGMGIVGHSPLFDSGSCQSSSDNCILSTPPNCGESCHAENTICVADTHPCADATKESCPKSAGIHGKCVWNPAEQLTGGTRAFYIVAGLGMIGFAVGIVLFAYWWNRKVHQDKNMAAFAGGLTAMNVMGSAFRG